MDTTDSVVPAKEIAGGPDEEGGFVVDIEEKEKDDGPEDAESEAKAGEPDQSRPSNKARRQNRFREMSDRADAAERRFQAAEQRQAQLETYVRDLANQTISRGQQQQQQAQGDGELDDIYEQTKAIAIRIQSDNSITHDELSKLETKARRLDIRKNELIAERAMSRSGMNRPQQQQVNPVIAGLMVQYNDVYSDQTALGWAQGWVMQQSSAMGRQPDLPMVQASLEAARRWKQERSGQRPHEPESGLREKMMGVPARGGNGQQRATHIKLSASQMRMARSMYPKLKEEQAYDKWAKTAGKKLMEGK